MCLLSSTEPCGDLDVEGAGVEGGAGRSSPARDHPLYPTEGETGGSYPPFWYSGKGQGNKRASDLGKTQLADRKMFIHSPREENLSHLFLYFNKICFFSVGVMNHRSLHMGSSTLQ